MRYEVIMLSFMQQCIPVAVLLQLNLDESITPPQVLSGLSTLTIQDLSKKTVLIVSSSIHSYKTIMTTHTGGVIFILINSASYKMSTTSQTDRIQREFLILHALRTPVSQFNLCVIQIRYLFVFLYRLFNIVAIWCAQL